MVEDEEDLQRGTRYGSRLCCHWPTKVSSVTRPATSLAYRTGRVPGAAQPATVPRNPPQSPTQDNLARRRGSRQHALVPVIFDAGCWSEEVYSFVVAASTGVGKPS